jgi:hypothetical protein
MERPSIHVTLIQDSLLPVKIKVQDLLGSMKFVICLRLHLFLSFLAKFIEVSTKLVPPRLSLTSQSVVLSEVLCDFDGDGRVACELLPHTGMKSWKWRIMPHIVLQGPVY